VRTGPSCHALGWPAPAGAEATLSLVPGQHGGPSQQGQLVLETAPCAQHLLPAVCGHSEPFCGGWAHFGNLRAAQSLVDAQLPRLVEGLQRLPGCVEAEQGFELGLGLQQGLGLGQVRASQGK